VHFTSAAAVPRLGALHLRPLVGDSARRTVLDTAGLPGIQSLDSAVVTTAAGNVIPNALVRYTSSDSLLASVTALTFSPQAPQVTARAPGVVLLRAEATVYGTRLTDSLLYVAGYPLRIICWYGTGDYFVKLDPAANVPPPPTTNVFSLGSLVVGQGGAVLWANSIAGTPHDSLDIQFDRTTDIGGVPTPIQFPDGLGPIVIPADSGGNIPAYPAAVEDTLSFGDITFLTKIYDSTTSKARTFTRPGTYQWRSDLQGIQGTVMVVSNDSLLAHRGQPALSYNR